LLRLLHDDSPLPASAVLGCGALAALLPADQLTAQLLQRMHTAAHLAVRTAAHSDATVANRNVGTRQNGS
jgi:hypothetical protein